MSKKRRIEEIGEDKELTEKAQTVNRLVGEMANIIQSYQNLTKFYYRLVREIERDPSLVEMIQANWKFMKGEKLRLPIPKTRAEAKEILAKYSLGIFDDSEEILKEEIKRKRDDSEPEGGTQMSIEAPKA